MPAMYLTSPRQIIKIFVPHFLTMISAYVMNLLILSTSGLTLEEVIKKKGHALFHSLV